MQGERLHGSIVGCKQVNRYGKGRRSAELIGKRNEKIVFRYYYKAVHKKMRVWEEILTELSKEFDIAEATIARLLTITLSDNTREIFKKKPTVRELKMRYPYMSWN